MRNTGKITWKTLILRLLVLPLCLLIVSEVLLRATGAGWSCRFFIADKQFKTPSFRANYLAARRFFPGDMARKPLPEHFTQIKQKNVVRIFVLGESAARGESLADFSFSRMLGVMLKNQFPNLTFEIINTGIPAINSWVIADFMPEFLKYQPDLFIFFGGHNEIIGPFGPGTVFMPMASRKSIQTRIWLSSLKLVQFARNTFRQTGIPTASATWQGLAMFQDRLLKASDKAVINCRENFRQNLTSMISAASKANIPFIACTAPSNLLDCAPFASLHDPKLSPNSQKKWSKIFQRGNTLLQQHNASDALAFFEQATQISPKHAETLFLEGVCYKSVNQFAKARHFLALARDNDAFMVRTTSSFNQAIASATLESPLAIFVDTEQKFEEASSNGLIGEALVYDHVHLTLKGHFLVAQALLHKIISKGLIRPSSDPGNISLSELLPLLGYSQRDELQDLEMTFSAMNGLPFSKRQNHDSVMKLISSKRRTILKHSRKEIAIDALQIYTKCLEKTPTDDRCASRLALDFTELGQPEEALVYFQKALTLNPGDCMHWNNQGLVYLALGNYATAMKNFQKALDLAPNFAAAWFNIGIVHQRQNQPQKAKAAFIEALKIHPGHTDARLNLGNILIKSGHLKKAEKQFRTILALHPRYVKAHINLSACLAKQGRLSEAKKDLRQTAMLSPDDPKAQLALARFALQQKDEKTAIKAFQATLALDTTNIDALEAITTILTDPANKTLANPGLAAEIAAKTCEATENVNPFALRCLTVALAADGQREEALKTAEKARLLAIQNDNKALVTELEGYFQALQASKVKHH